VGQIQKKKDFFFLSGREENTNFLWAI